MAETPKLPRLVYRIGPNSAEYESEADALAARFPDDIAALVAACRDAGYEVSPHSVAAAYAEFSEEEWCAGWLTLGEPSGLFKSVSTYLAPNPLKGFRIAPDSRAGYFPAEMIAFEDDAPAAPSVGEPEPYTDDEMALVLAELPNWLEHVETRECPVCHNRSGGFKMSCPPICTSCGWKSKVHPSMIEQAIPEIAARLSALRSSLEEARKDSERLDFALSDGSLYTWRRKTSGKGEVFFEGDVIKDRPELDRRIAEFRADPTAHLTPRAPSPRDEP